jgi:hypothetical protein
LKNRTFAIGIWALLLGPCAVLSAGCGATAADVDYAAGAGGASAGGAGADNGGSKPYPSALTFVPDESLELKPKQVKELTVQTIPPGPFLIRFGFEGGDAADAVLDVSEVEADADGIAHVTLVAPSQPSAFNVRAASIVGTVVKAQVKLGVSVSATGLTSLRVRPSYSGQRTVSEWTATVSWRSGVSCNDLAGNPPPDGERVRTVELGAPLEISEVPVDLPLVVTVRAGHYIGGCLNVPALSEGDGNQVLVYASDRPLNLDATELSLSLGATDAHPEFDKLLQASASAAENALLGSAKNDVAALLDKMRDATPAGSRETFNLARSLNGWDSALDSAFGKGAARRMRDPAQRWLTAGLLALDAPDALVGQVRSFGSGLAFTPTRVGSEPPSSAGFPGLVEGTWSADSNDTVLLGMDLSWEPSRLVTALAIAPARQDFPQATSAELALSLSVDCAAVGQVLVTNGVVPGSTAFANCDVSCAANLCGEAVAAAWTEAQRSSGAEMATLSITATGAAQVGDEAQAIGLSGSWVGQFRSEGSKAQVSGALTAR